MKFKNIWQNSLKVVAFVSLSISLNANAGFVITPNNGDSEREVPREIFLGSPLYGSNGVTIYEEQTEDKLYYNIDNQSGQEIWSFAVSNTDSFDSFNYFGWARLLVTMDFWDEEFSDKGSFASFFGEDTYAYYFYAYDNAPSISAGMTYRMFGLNNAPEASDFVAFGQQGNVISQSRSVPEPSSLALFSLAVVGFAARRRGKS